MPAEDARRWNHRYRNEDRRRFTAARPLLITRQDLVPTGTRVLDVACGLGSNAAPLLERGCSVVGVDIAIAALRRARQCLPDLQVVLADLTELRFPPGIFGCILNFFTSTGISGLSMPACFSQAGCCFMKP